MHHTRKPARFLLLCLALATSPLAAAGQAKKARRAPAPKPYLARVAIAEPAPSPADALVPAHQGRIVVHATRCPGCTVDLLGPDESAVVSIEVPPKSAKPVAKALRPGTYSVAVSAKGSATVILPSCVVKAGHDTRIDVEFSTARRAKASGQKVKRLPTWKPPKEPMPPVKNFKPDAFGKIKRDLSLGREKPGKKGRGRKKGRAKHPSKKKGKGKKNAKK